MGEVSQHQLGRVYVESWTSGYGSPVQIDPEEGGTPGSLIDEEGFDFVVPVSGPLSPLAFIDGTRRQEAALSQLIDGQTITGLAGAYAVGAVIVDGSNPPYFDHIEVDRVVIWPEGISGSLPNHPSGWSWRATSTPDTNPDGPMKQLQALMRGTEARLASKLAGAGHLVLLDGPLTYAAAYQQPGIAGYVKTHHRRLLPEAEAKRLPELLPGHRTSLFHVDEKRYSCYLRLAPYSQWHSPMSGIVRLEIPAVVPLAEARVLVDRLSFLLPSYAGIAHIDPRAPQNLQPTGALEKRLRHLMSRADLAERAVREVVAQQFAFSKGIP